MNRNIGIRSVLSVIITNVLFSLSLIFFLDKNDLFSLWLFLLCFTIGYGVIYFKIIRVNMVGFEIRSILNPVSRKYKFDFQIVDKVIIIKNSIKWSSVSIRVHTKERKYEFATSFVTKDFMDFIELIKPHVSVELYGHIID